MKTAEILILRHQLAVLQRQQPRRLKLNWADMRGKTGRPATRWNIRALVLRLARENPGWDTAGSTVSWPAWEWALREQRNDQWR